MTFDARAYVADRVIEGLRALTTVAEELPGTTRDLLTLAARTWLDEDGRIREVERALAAASHPFAGMHLPPDHHVRWNVGAGGVGAFGVPCDCEQNVDHQVAGPVTRDEEALMREAGYNPHSIVGQTAWRRQQKES